MAENYTMLEPYLEYQVPFCRPFVCTGDVANVLWNCVPHDCKAYVTVFLAVAVMLAAMTITFNCLILGINLASKTRRMRKRNPTMSNYSIYVVSLAVADLLVGVVVLPLCAVNFYFEFMVNELPNQPINAVNGSVNLEMLANSGAGNLRARIVVNSLENRQMATTTATGLRAVIDEPIAGNTILQVLGIFTHLTLFVSVYTLIAASADRLYAASYSARFTSSQITKSGATDQTKTSWLRQLATSARRSTVAVFIVWVLGIVFALVPVALDGHFYFRHVGHIFSAMASAEHYSAGVRWYLFTLVIPLIGMWLLNVMICFTLWRRKSQLGLRRKRSLRRTISAGKNEELPVSPRLVSQSDSVFEDSATEGTPAQKYPASKWNTDGGFSDVDFKPQIGTPRALYRHKPASGSGGNKTPGSFYSQTFQWDSRGSVLRRKVSSIRRAKEMLKRQSYEASITKTLCIVVVAFTLAVLPLIISLGKTTVGQNSTKKTLNKEVTALTCSLLLLFSNSFVNCVIYGARMRDFRTTLCQLFRTISDKIKNTLCCCCPASSESFPSEVVSGVFLVTKRQRAELHQRSPRLAGTNTVDRFGLFSRAPSKKSMNQVSTLDKENIHNKRGDKQISPKVPNSSVLTSIRLDPNQKRNTRPSSSGYRTDPEPHSTQDDAIKNRYSQRSDVTENTNKESIRRKATQDNQATSSEEKEAASSDRMVSLSEKEDSDVGVILNNSSGTETVEKAEESRNLLKPESEVFSEGDDCSQDSDVRNSNVFTFDIDFSNFSSL